MEIWKDIYFIENGVEWDYRGLYQVSNYGRVKSLNYRHTGKEKILKAGKRNNDYLFFTLYKNSKTKQFYIHRLVAYMFLDDYFENAEVNHIDEDKSNNHASNLEWKTHKDNCNHGTRNEKLSNNHSKYWKGKNRPEHSEFMKNKS